MLEGCVVEQIRSVELFTLFLIVLHIVMSLVVKVHGHYKYTEYTELRGDLVEVRVRVVYWRGTSTMQLTVMPAAITGTVQSPSSLLLEDPNVELLK